jgi:RNA polymerase sigma factor (sigma-70 family)
MEGNLTGDADVPLYHGLKACLDGEGDGEAAVRQLLPRIKRYVRKGCPALGSEADAIAVLVIERVCERLDTFRDQSHFFLWVAGITRNVIQERLWDQTERAQSNALLMDRANASPEGIVLDQMAHEVNCLLVEEALASLTDAQRAVLVYQHTTDLTSAQIGEKVDRSTNAVRHALVDAHAAVARWRKTKGY